MLHNLPLEIIIAISRFLDLGDKLKLIKTCQRLHEVISKTSLFEEPNLFDSRFTSLEKKVVEHFEKNPEYGSQVKILFFDMYFLRKNLYFITDMDDYFDEPRLPYKETDHDDEIFYRLPDIFPNVTKLRTSKKYGETIFVSENLTDSIAKWIQNFDSYDDVDWYWAWSFLENYTLPRLLELGINGKHHNGKIKWNGKNEEEERYLYGEENEQNMDHYNMQLFLPRLKKCAIDN